MDAWWRGKWRSGLGRSWQLYRWDGDEVHGRDEGYWIQSRLAFLVGLAAVGGIAVAMLAGTLAKSSEVASSVLKKQGWTLCH